MKQLRPLLPKAFLTSFLLASSGIFVFLISRIRFLPLNYIIIACVTVIAILFFIIYVLWFSRNKKVSTILRNISIIVFSLSIVVISLGINEIQHSIFRLFAEVPSTGTSNIVLLAYADDNITSLNQILDDKIAIQNTVDLENQNYAIKFMESELGKPLPLTEYEDILMAVDAFLDKQCRFLLINESYLTVLNSDEKYEDFSYITKAIFEVPIEFEVEVFTSDARVTEEPFNILISATDSYGKIPTIYRSDVNMIVSVNPKTKQVLITSIPRDTYCSIPCWGGAKDKLTHASAAGWREPSGINCLIDTVEQYFALKIDFYVQLNFSSLITVVDALGGIQVDNPYEFTFSYPPKNTYKQGLISLDGQQALQYSRERKSLEHGDMDRNLHQTIVLKAIINKVLQPSTLTKSGTILDALSNVYQTNFTGEQITSLIKMQLSDFASWNISSQSLQGQMVKKLSALLTKYKVFDMCVIYPNQLEKARENIAALFNDEILKDTTLPEGIKQNISNDKPKQKPSDAGPGDGEEDEG